MSDYYRTTFTFSVLSDGPIPAGMQLDTVLAECDDGAYVLDYGTANEKAEKLTPKQMADALYAAGSEPGFFNLDDDGKDTLDAEDIAYERAQASEAWERQGGGGL